MAVTKEWMCRAHGAFESQDDPPLCPHGCDTVDRAFLTPVGLRSARTTNIDSTFESLARTHGMTDISNRGGRAAKRQDPMQASRNADMSRLIRERYGDGWGAIPKSGTMRTDTREIVGGGNGPASVLAKYGAQPANTVEQVKEAFVPKPVIYRHDHENLQVSQVNK